MSVSQPPTHRSGWLVYLIQNPEGLLYCGISNRPEVRLANHNANKGARFTKGKGPWRFVYQEPAESMPAALKRERAIKKMSRAAKLKLVSSPDPLPQ